MKKTLLALFALAASLSSQARAETIWYPLPAEAYTFGQRYPEAQKLLYAFDYGHALLYERLLLERGHVGDPAKLEQEILAGIMAILKNPPSVKPAEEDIAPTYSFQFPLVLNLFDWSHYLHQFTYDIMANATDRGPAMKARMDAVYRQYQDNRPIVITDQCKTMLFMDGHYFSKAFRRTYPSLNLLIWSYHWLQIKLYDALMAPTLSERDKNVADVVKQFWALVSDLPDSADFDMMPSMAQDAPAFTRIYPGISATFDNLHMLHDVLSDIIVSSKVADGAVKSEGIRFGRMAQDPNAFKAQTCKGD